MYITTRKHSLPAGSLGAVEKQNGFVTNIVPYRGITQTVSLMRDFIRDGQRSLPVRRVAEKLVENIYPKDYLSEIAAIYFFIANPRNFRYTRDPKTVELVRDPEAALKMRKLDCDCMTALAASLAATLGAEVQIIPAGFVPNRISHVFVRVDDPRSHSWVVVDPVAGPRTGTMLRRVKRYHVYDMEGRQLR